MAKRPFRYTDRFWNLAPPWLRNRWLSKFGQVVAGAMDLVRFGAEEATRASLLEYENANGERRFPPDDAVPHHAAASAIDPVDGESVGSWRERVLGRWEFWENVTRKGPFQDAMRLYMKLPTQLFVYDYILASEGGDEFQSGSGGAGDDANLDYASRLAIVIEQTHGWVRPVVGPGLVVGPNLMVGLSMTQNELSRLRKYFLAFRPPNCVGTDAWIIMDSTPAEDLLNDHTAAGSEVIRIPLQGQFVGYSYMVVGGSLVVGQAFT